MVWKKFKMSIVHLKKKGHSVRKPSLMRVDREDATAWRVQAEAVKEILVLAIEQCHMSTNQKPRERKYV